MMQRIKNIRSATQTLTAVLLFGMAFVAGGAEQMMRALPVPAAVQSTAVPVAQPPGSPAKPMSQGPADAPTSRMKQAPQASPSTTIPTPVALLPNLWLDVGVYIGGTFVPYVSIGTPTLHSSVMIQSPNGIKGEGCRFPLSFNVKNDGGGPTSSSFDVKVEIVQEQRTVSSTGYAMNQLNPGATETENTGFEVLPGTYAFLLTIDPYHKVKQANPGDKQYRIMFNARCGEGNTSTLAPAAPAVVAPTGLPSVAKPPTPSVQMKLTPAPQAAKPVHTAGQPIPDPVDPEFRTLPGPTAAVFAPARTKPGVAALNSGAINTAVVAEPMTVNFGSVFSGDSRRAVVRVVSPRDGKVTVALAPNSPFSIADVKVYGMAETKSGGATSNRVLKKSPAPQQLKAAGPSAAPTLVSNFSRSLLATSTSAPYTVAAREGNELVVSLVFAPKFDLFNGLPVGDHNTTLALDGGMWKTSVPVSGRFEGLKIGVVAVMSNPDVTVFTGTTGVLPDVELVLINTDKQAVSALYSAKHLPPGFALAQMNVQIPAGQTRKVTLPVIVNSAMHEGAQQTAELTVSYSGTVKTVPFTFSVYPPWKQIHYSGKDGLEWEFWMTISPTGNTYYAYQVKNPNYLLNRRFMFEVRWKGMRLNAMGNNIGNHFPGKKGDFVPYAWSIQNNVVRDNYVQMLQDAPTVSMTYENL